MKKITYLIDGNYYLHKTLSVCGAFDKNDPMFLVTDDEDKKEKNKNSLLHKLTMDLCSDVRKASSIIDEIIITMDDYSWRNDFFNNKSYSSYEPDFDKDGNLLDLEGNIIATADEYKQAESEQQKRFHDIASLSIDYKGNRVKDKSFNWEFVYYIFDEFLTDISNICKVKRVRIPGCEGDDLIFAISSYYVSLGKSVMIYSGDNDLKQLISHNNINDSFVIHYKKTESKIVMTNETAKYLSHKDDNGSMHNVSLGISRFSNSNGIELVVEDPFEIVFTKVLKGDAGDNVRPVIIEPRQFASGKRKGQWRDVGIDKRVIDKIKNELEYERFGFLDFFNTDFLNLLARSILRNFKPKQTFSAKGIYNNIEINRDLMLLHKNCIPQSIYENMINWVDKSYKENYLEISSMFSYKDLLEKNPHYTVDPDAKKSTSANLFKHLGL